MARITEANVRHFTEEIARHTGTDIRVEWAYGKPKIYLYHLGECQGELSPRLPTGQMYSWLDAFLKGYNLGKHGIEYWLR